MYAPAMGIASAAQVAKTDVSLPEKYTDALREIMRDADADTPRPVAEAPSDPQQHTQPDARS